MALVIRLLNTGVLNGAGPVPVYPNNQYAPPSAGVLGTIVNNIRIVNVATPPGTATVTLNFTPSGGSQLRILDQAKPINNGDILVVKPELTMVPGDLIQLASPSGGSFEFVVSGVEKK